MKRTWPISAFSSRSLGMLSLGSPVAVRPGRLHRRLLHKRWRVVIPAESAGFRERGIRVRAAKIGLPLSTRLPKPGSGRGAEMAEDPNAAAQPKSLADILAEELDGQLGAEQTQELPVQEKQERLRAVY